MIYIKVKKLIFLGFICYIFMCFGFIFAVESVQKSENPGVDSKRLPRRTPRQSLTAPGHLDPAPGIGGTNCARTQVAPLYLSFIERGAGGRGRDPFNKTNVAKTCAFSNERGVPLDMWGGPEGGG